MRCEKCGNDFDASLVRCPKCGASVEFSGNTKFYQKAMSSKLHMKDIFAGTFRKHPSGTAAKVFAAGTPTTTPTVDRMLSEWQKPWLYSRFLIAGLLFIVIGFIMAYTINAGMIMSVWSFGSIVIPVAVLMFIWEMNIPRDISFMKVLAIFFVGGILSLALTGLLSVVDYEPPFAAFFEEPAKLLITLFFIHKMKVKYGSGGMLIGAAVGAGFCVFEDIAYVFIFLMEGSFGDANAVFVIRALTSLGGHTVWAAIAGAAAALGRKGSRKGARYLISPLFWGCFITDVLLHFIWNGGLEYFDIDYSDLQLVILTVIANVLLFFLMRKCVKQVLQVYDAARMMAGTAPEPAPEPADAIPAQAAYAGQTAPVEKAQTPVIAPMPVQQKYYLHADATQIEGDYALDKVLVIGRDTSVCNIVFPADTAGVSRRHCAVQISPDGKCYVMDLNSTVGTFTESGNRLPPNEWTLVDSPFYTASPNYLFTVLFK